MAQSPWLRTFLRIVLKAIKYYLNTFEWSCNLKWAADELLGVLPSRRRTGTGTNAQKATTGQGP